MAAGTGRDSAAVERDHGAAAVTGGSAGRAWLAALPDELAAQRRVLAGLIEYSENTPLVSLLLVGCSLGRGAADALSEIDAAMAVCAESGGADAEQVRAAEAALVAALPSLGTNLASDGAASPYAVTGEQVREWAFRGWCALIDADKYLCRGSLWEAHNRLHEARKHIWALWAAATGALYPWHGLSQVLDNDPRSLPPASKPPWPASTRRTCAGPSARVPRSSRP
jgi:hypothetical protein